MAVRNGAEGIGFDSMPLFVAGIRYGALSRYRCVPAEDERGRYAGRNGMQMREASAFGPDAVKLRRDSSVFLFLSLARSRLAYSQPPPFGAIADDADYGMPKRAFLEHRHRADHPVTVYSVYASR